MLARRFSRLGTTSLLFALVSALAAAPPAARAQSYQPLQVGNQWVYSYLPGGSETKTVTGTVRVFGREAFVIRYGPSLDNEGLENYWSTSPDDDVLLHGFNRTLDPGWNFIYDPPVVMLDAPPALGGTWTQTVTWYTVSGPDTIPAGTFPLTYAVLEAGDLTVPAGTFYAFGIGTPPEIGARFASAGAFTVTGDRITTLAVATDWWAEGVGLVRTGDYVLEAFGGPTGADAITWGGLKALYRR